ncbi:MAG: cytochrome c biogenesis CcdA family protein [Halobacteriota archaeon]|nr:cytochrome c biogenesis CcdA family protein [Halobacteriota archaeon]
MVSPILAFSFGLLSFLNPCVLPVVPAVVAYSTKSGRFQPIMIAIGLSLSFTAMGIIATLFGSTLKDYLSLLKITAGLIIIFLGLYMLFEVIGKMIDSIRPAFTRLNLGGRLSSINTEGSFGGFILGLSLGLVWTPCVGPILGSILTMVAVEGDLPNGALLLLFYSLGFVIPLLIVAYASNTAVSRVKAVSSYGGVIKKVSGIVLIIAGVYMSYQPFLSLLY